MSGYPQNPNGPGYGQGGHGGEPQNPYGQHNPYGPGQPGAQPPAGPAYGHPGTQPGAQPSGPSYGQPGAGQPGQPGPGQPGYQPYPGAGAPNYPARPNGIQPTNPGGKNKLPLIIGGAIAAVLVIAIITTVALVSGRDKAATPDPNDPNPPVTDVKSPKAVVEAYLNALAAGDATTALSLSSEQPIDKTFTTNEFLAAALKDTPITEIVVADPASEYTYSVDASYKMGDQKVNTSLSVTEDGDTYKIRQGYVEANMEYQRKNTLPLLLNGTEITTDKIFLLPGSYELTTGLKFIDYGTEGKTLIKGLDDYPSFSAQPAMTDDGSKQFVASAQKLVNACVKQKTLAPKGCGFALSEREGYKYDLKSLVWKVDGNPFAEMKPRLDYDNPTTASVTSFVRIKAEIGCTFLGRKGTCPGTAYINGKFTADMSKDTVTVEIKDR